MNINRQKLIEELNNLSLDIELWTSMKPNEIVNATIQAYMKFVMETIESQPPADQWIPCSSGRVPKEKEIVHVTILNEDSGERRTADTKFDGRDYAIRLDYSERIVAWMPANLPEPYKGE